MRILVSAGHTNNPNSDRGAAGNGFIEGVEAVKIRDAVAADLRLRGFEVVEDGSDGVNDPLKKAIALAKTSDIAIEIHFNASTNATATGVEVLAKPKNKKLSQEIAKSIAANLDIPMRGVDSGWKSDSSGQHHRLGFCEAGGLIVEVCFISNPKDMQSYRESFTAMCSGIATAVADNTVGDSDSIPERDLKFGDKGSDVRALQVKLNLFLNSHIEVDGDFGKGTKTALMEFQKRNGLDVDGIAGPNTRAKLGL